MPYATIPDSMSCCSEYGSSSKVKLLASAVQAAGTDEAPPGRGGDGRT